jgi:hypothetical protein
LQLGGRRRGCSGRIPEAGELKCILEHEELSVANQGKLLSGADISKIVVLLKTTEISMSDIAIRMGCSRSAVATINRRCCIRYYNGRRSVWAKAPDAAASSQTAAQTKAEHFGIAS